MNNLKDKPFALIGVNNFNEDPDNLKQVMTEENLNWRSFAHSAAIADQWNLPPTPAYYIIDHTGKIRHKWIGSPGEKAIDTALEHLIREAEDAEQRE